MYTFRTSPPPTYITPSVDEMREVAKQVELKSFARDLVADLCHLAAGGTINPPSQYRSQVRQRVEEQLPAPNKIGNWQVPDLDRGGNYTKWTSNRFEAIEALTAKKLRYHQNVCDFLQTVDLARIPGDTPLTKAISLLKLLSKQQGGSGGGENGEPLPIFTDNDHPEGEAEKLHETIDTVDSLNQEELDMLDPEGENHKVESEDQDGQRQGTQELNRLKVAEDLMDENKRAMLDVSRHLDTFTKLQVRRQKLVEPDPAGEEVRQRSIQHLGELSRVTKQSWGKYRKAKSYFLYQATTGQLPVRERVTRLEKKQAIVILLDVSGSMSGKRHWKASGVVMNRLKAVVAGDAEVYLFAFDTEIKELGKATTPAEAREMIKKFMAKNFSGGGTNIAAGVKGAHKFIEEKIREGALLYRPEVVVLTDEDSSVTGVRRDEIPGTTVHGFAMEAKNPALVSFAKSTGGVGIDKF